MPRKSKGPWYWKARKQWYVDLKGKRHALGPDKEEAERRWHELMAKPAATPVKSTALAVILDTFLDWTKRNREPSTYEWYLQRLSEFDAMFPELDVEELTPAHVAEWADAKRSTTHRRGCMIAIIRAMNWAVKQRKIASNPLKGMELPPAATRETVLTDEQYKAILETASDQQFKDLLTFCWETGCRPQEAFRMEARHFDAAHARVVFPKEEAKGKKKARVIHLTDTAQEIVARLSKKHPTGPLLRNKDGKPWRRNNVACRFRRMETKLGFRGKLYFLRHTFLTNGLKAGVDPITLAVIAGHSDPAMLARVYQHVQQDTDHMQSALKKVRPEVSEVPPAQGTQP